MAHATTKRPRPRRRIRQATSLGFLTLVAVCLLSVGCAPKTVVLEPSDRPNVVLILTDDLDVGLLQRYHERYPNLGELAAEGTTFENAFVTDPLCCPSRATILRGQYSHNHRIVGNKPPQGGFEKFRSLGHESSTVATWLQDEGYRTLFVGKYMNGYHAEHVPPGWDEWHGITSNYLGNALNNNGRIRQYDPERYHLDDVLAGKAVDYVRQSKDSDMPFFMWLGTKAPHLPAVSAPRHQDAFSKTPLPRLPSFNEKDVSDKPDWIRNNPPLEPWQIADMEALQRQRLRSLLAVDEMIGRLVETLRQNGELDDTYIFFTSDNGFHLGEHRLTTGKWTAYEEDTRVPLVVRGPGVPEGRKLEEMALNNDLAPTFADLAGIEAPSFVDGRSLVPLLGKEPFDGSWRKAFLIEAPAEPDRDPLPPPSVDEGSILPLVTGDPLPEDRREASPAELRKNWGRPGLVAVRTEGHLYVEYETGERELYNLREDPYQLDNHYGEANPALLKRLKGHLEALRECSGADCPAAEDGP